jgi:hypothetical protein
MSPNVNIILHPMWMKKKNYQFLRSPHGDNWREVRGAALSSIARPTIGRGTPDSDFTLTIEEVVRTKLIFNLAGRLPLGD